MKNNGRFLNFYELVHFNGVCLIYFTQEGKQ